jgi:hypothetical protein
MKEKHSLECPMEMKWPLVGSQQEKIGVAKGYHLDNAILEFRITQN